MKMNIAVLTLTNNGHEHLDYPTTQSKITEFFRTGRVGDYNVAQTPEYIGLRDTETNLVIAIGRLDEKYESKKYQGRYKFLCSDIRYVGLPYDFNSSNPDYNGHQNPVKYGYYDPEKNTLTVNI